MKRRGLNVATAGWLGWAYVRAERAAMSANDNEIAKAPHAEGPPRHWVERFRPPEWPWPADSR